MSIDFKRVVVPLTVGIVCIFAFRSYFSQENQVDKQINIPSAIGTKEDPHARALYEWNRLRSPVTRTIPQKIRSRELAFAKSIPSKESAIRQGLNKSANPFASQVFEWERVGPFNLGGRTRAVVLDVSDPSEGTLLAGGVSGGVWRYYNLLQDLEIGYSFGYWVEMTNPADLHSVTMIAQDPRPGKTNIWYFGTGEFYGNSANDFSGNGLFLGDGIFKSVDGEFAWNQLIPTASGTPHRFDSEFDFIWNLENCCRSIKEFIRGCCLCSDL